ncbi:NAD(P)/FAD-dependent oxidoreductase [Deinococcus planocerae]|uniref:NAD(P)/FAD-dependent oxidoreductase n=1 Tax=Deinococcus planocerae TaxID=1737569 RepID=UPI000C7EFF68|nr:NAD(P)-binding protein [Deinococcus planocerae]
MSTDLLIVGAGLAGLALAGDAVRDGMSVQLLDKSRGISGRASTRRVTLDDGREARLDHGARFFTARHDRTRALAEGGVQGGWPRVWTRSVSEWREGSVTTPPSEHPRYVPPAGMSALGRHLARGLSVTTGAEVTSLERTGGGWRVHTRDGATFAAPRLVLNLPGPQVAPLLHDLMDDVPGLAGAAGEVGRVRYDPYWAAGVVLERDLEAEWVALRLYGHPVLEWIAREHTKREPGHPPALMLHATPDWTRAQLERRPQEVLPDLLTAAREVVGDFTPLDAFAHRWRYATPTERAPGPAHWDPALGIGWCGDWHTPDPNGPRVEAALLSGWALARRVPGEDERDHTSPPPRVPEQEVNP